MSLGCAASIGWWRSLSLVTPLSVALVSVAMIGLVAAAWFVVGADARGRHEPAAVSSATRRAGWLALLWLVALFSTIVTAKLLLMREVPVTAPFWDQWDGEASAVLVPFQHCTLTWPAMFGFHNEHRLFFTRLLALDLVIVNGQWDPRLEQVVDAMLHASIAVLIVTTFWIANRRRRLDLLVLLCLPAFALPFSWENTLVGFQSQFYFLLLFTLLALWLTTWHPTGSRPWWIGWMCAICGIFTAASGVLIPVAILVVVALKLLDDRRQWRDALINAGVAAAVGALGALLASPPLPQHAALKAVSVVAFATALGNALAFPWIFDPRVSLVMWLPFAALIVGILYRRGRSVYEERLVAGLGAWVLLNAAALAYGRGGGGAVPTSRYLDFLSLGPIANGMALLVGLDRLGGRRSAKRVTLAACAAWSILALVGSDRLLQTAFAELVDWRSYFAAQAASVREYMVTNDLPALLARRPPIELPYPVPETLASYLQYPEIRSILPASIRQPIGLIPQAVTNGAFVPDGSPVAAHHALDRTWGSYAAEGRRTQGRFDSAPIACVNGGQLRFAVSGYLGTPHQYLAVKELRSGRERAVRPPAVPGEGWLDAMVPCPAGAFAVIAIDADPDSWFAFREPVEVGRPSVVAEWLIANSRAALLLSLALLLISIHAMRGQ